MWGKSGRRDGAGGAGVTGLRLLQMPLQRRAASWAHLRVGHWAVTGEGCGRGMPSAAASRSMESTSPSGDTGARRLGPSTAAAETSAVLTGGGRSGGISSSAAAPEDCTGPLSMCEGIRPLEPSLQCSLTSLDGQAVKAFGNDVGSGWSTDHLCMVNSVPAGIPPFWPSGAGRRMH